MKNFIFLTFYSYAFLFSQNTNMPQSVLSSGVVQSESEQTKLVGTIGQVFTSKVVSPNTILSSGFWGSMEQITLGIDDLLPEEFSISNAYPNPFNPTVSIDFSIPEKTDVNIQVFDLLGRNIFTHQQDFTFPVNTGSNGMLEITMEIMLLVESISLLYSIRKIFINKKLHF